MADSLSHARHDRFVIAAAIGDARVPASVRTCQRCGALHRDLRSIQTALRHAWTPKLPRDLRLDVDDIARLRSAWWRRVIGAIGSSRDAISRPLAVGLTSFGIVGLVLTSTASGLGGAASSAPPTEAVIQVTEDPTAGPAVRDVAQETAHIDPVLALSSGSLATGGAVLVLRRMGARVRGVR